MLDDYTNAFTHYLRTGAVGALSEFYAEDADLARLRVYRNGFVRACIEALRASYPSVERLVGEERFPGLARPYVDLHPPRSASLVEYGEDFPRFLEDARDTHDLDYLSSFAALDRAWTEVYFARDDSFPDMPASGIPGDAEALMSLCGRLAPWVRQVSLEYRVLDAWSRLRHVKLGQRTAVPRAPQQILIWRSGADVLYRDLAPPEHMFISRVAAGWSCGEAAGAALEIDAELNLAETFASLLHYHMLTFEH